MGDLADLVDGDRLRRLVLVGLEGEQVGMGVGRHEPGIALVHAVGCGGRIVEQAGSAPSPEQPLGKRVGCCGLADPLRSGEYEGLVRPPLGLGVESVQQPAVLD